LKLDSLNEEVKELNVASRVEAWIETGDSSDLMELLNWVASRVEAWIETVKLAHPVI